MEPDEDLRTSLVTQSGLPEPAKVTEWSRQYIDSTDPIAQFVEASCTLGGAVKGRAAHLFETYTSWFVRSGQEGDQMTATKFGRALGKVPGVAKGHDEFGAFYLGVAPMSAVALAEREG